MCDVGGCVAAHSLDFHCIYWCSFPPDFVKFLFLRLCYIASIYIYQSLYRDFFSCIYIYIIVSCVNQVSKPDQTLEQKHAT